MGVFVLNRKLQSLKHLASPLRGVGIAALSIAALLGLMVAIQVVPEWQVRRANVHSSGTIPEAKPTAADVAALENEMRKTLIQIVGGAFAIIALYFTYRRVKVSEQGHITDRFTKAVEQLGATTAENKPNLESRLGAIYALERIAIDSPRDHWTIMEVLTAYVRQNTAMQASENPAADITSPTTDIQAILTVLGRRPRGNKREKDRSLNLQNCDLNRGDFSKANMDGADFSGSLLREASFYSGSFRHAKFSRVKAERTTFQSADLQFSDFDSAELKQASFENADLSLANFDFANVAEARFAFADVDPSSFQNALGVEHANNLVWRSQRADP